MIVPITGLDPGALIAGRYEVIEELGKGGMGIVYRVHDRRIDEDVALKVLHSEIASDPRTLERFRGELKLARRIAHKNVCKMFHLGEEAGISFLLMEYVPGRDLKSVLRTRGRIPVRESVEIGRQIAEGLAEAHRRGVVHRDLKPGNIMIDNDGAAKIMDFGIARSLGSRGLTEAGILVGTPGYLSPEQAAGRQADGRSDIYALGAVLFEMVTGRPPFEGESPRNVALKHRTAEPADPRQLNPEVPEALSRIILRCLSRDREKRYQSADDLASDLAAVERGAPPAALKATEIEAAGDERAAGRRRRVRLIAAAAAAFPLILAGLFLVPKRAAPAIDSIAVLPLQNLSGDPEQDFFAAGITEDIITQLSKIGGLRVISRTSVWRYKDTSKSIPEIGRELNVAAILEGSVRREGDRIRIVGQLIDARKDEHLWAETYDRRISDIFDIQSEVAERIAGELRIRLSAAERERIARRPTEDIDAYAYYVKGREHYYQYTKDDNGKAIEYFQKAVDLDPAYAQAWAGLADAIAIGYQSFGFSDEALDSALEIGRKAVTLDPQLAEAHKALGLVLELLDRPEEGIASYNRAVELNPSFAPVIMNIGSYNFSVGRFDEALKWHRRGVELQPGISRWDATVALQYHYLGYDDIARRWLNRAIEFQPGAVFPRLVQGYIDLYAGRTEEARARVAGVLADAPDDFIANDAAGDIELLDGRFEEAKARYERLVSLGFWKGMPANKLAYSLKRLGEWEDAARWLERNLEACLEDHRANRPGSPIPYYLAQIYAMQGKKTESLEALEKAERLGYYDPWILHDPILESIRGEPRFAEIESRFKNRVSEMRKRVPEWRLDR